MRYFIALIVLAWFGGFLWFVVALPQPLEGPGGQAAIVPTGAAGRIDRGLSLLDQDVVKAVMITGVDRNVTKEDFARTYDVSQETLKCCISLGYSAVDTRTNATEAADWAVSREYISLRLITTDWHMRRAAGELRRVLPENIAIYRDAVPSEPSLRILFVEYHKFLASEVAGLFEGN